MLKKFGIVSVGVTAALLTAAPLASAHGSDSHDSHKGHWGHESHESHSSVNQRGEENIACAFTGGNAATAGENGTSLANVLAQAPIGGNNIGNIADCSNILNHSLNHNFSDNKLAILGTI